MFFMSLDLFECTSGLSPSLCPTEEKPNPTVLSSLKLIKVHDGHFAKIQKIRDDISIWIIESYMFDSVQLLSGSDLNSTTKL